MLAGMGPALAWGTSMTGHWAWALAWQGMARHSCGRHGSVLAVSHVSLPRPGCVALQCTAIIASHTHEQRQKFAASGAPASFTAYRCSHAALPHAPCRLGGPCMATSWASFPAGAPAAGAATDRPLPSLVVCPSTLVAHWPFEISKFVATDVLRPLAYHGTPAERTALRRQLAQHDVLVMSYESLRAGACGFVKPEAGMTGRGLSSLHEHAHPMLLHMAACMCSVIPNLHATSCQTAASRLLPPAITTDVDWVCSQAWAYCVLDEGHAIRNPSSKISQAAKRAGLAAQHRLLLSGTPVQNSERGCGCCWIGNCWQRGPGRVAGHACRLCWCSTGLFASQRPKLNPPSPCPSCRRAGAVEPV